MRRSGTALVALLALVALAGAAGTFGAVDGPSVADGETPTGPATLTEAPPPTGEPSGAADSGARRVSTETPTAPTGETGGLSPLVVPSVVGSLLVAGLFVVFLTGDDDRAPAMSSDADSNDDPTPAVDPEYDSPDANAVTESWRALSARVDGDDAATPREVAARALDRRLPESAVSTITERFRSVRYGDEPPAEGDAAEAADAAERLDETAADADGDRPSGGR